MKKFLSLTLALLLILSMTATAFAAEEAGDDEQTPTPSESSGVTYAASDATSFTIKKTYNEAVKETLNFTVDAASTNPDTTTLTVGTDNSANVNGKSNDITVTVPSYSTAGKYEYTIKETAGTTAGVTYTDSEIHVIVYVGYDNASDTKALKILNTESYIKKASDGTKADTFENTFKSGSFTVAKDVIGNMANENDKFDITVTLTSTKKVGNKISVGGVDVDPEGTTESPTWVQDQTNNVYTYTKTLTISESDGATTFANIPEGVTVTVVEKNVGSDNKVGEYTYMGVFTRTTTTNEDDTVTTTDASFNGLTITDGSNTAIVVKNEKKTEVATGVSLDTVPYFLMLAVACVGMFLLLSKKRAYREN